MARLKKITPQLSPEDKKPLWEIDYKDLPPARKEVLRAAFRIYVDWLMTDPKILESIDVDEKTRKLYQADRGRILQRTGKDGKLPNTNGDWRLRKALRKATEEELREELRRRGL